MGAGDGILLVSAGTRASSQVILAQSAVAP